MSSIIETPREKRLRRIISGTLIGCSLIGAIAIAMPKKEKRVEAPIAPIAKAEPVVEQPKVEPVQEIKPVVVDETAIVAEKIQVAMPHEDAETNYLEVAQLMTDQGDTKGAFESLRKHIYKNEPTSEVLLNIGRFGRQLGEHAIAEQALLDAAQLEPTSATIQTELGRVMLEVGELEDARAHARQAIRLAADDPDAWNLAGRVAMKQSEWARAEGAFRRALELEPMNAMIHNNVGLLYVYTGRASDAVDSLETAVELFGETVPYFAYNNLGLAHEMAGNYEEARDAFEEALSVNPTYARATVNLKRVMSTIAQLEEKTSFQTAQGVEPEPKDSL